MLYHKHLDWHVLFLSPAETDRFFEAFDPQDKELASHLYHNGHRFIKEDTYGWLEANVGEVGVDWRHEGTKNSREFMFRDKDKAMLFKLTFFEGD